MTPYLGEIRMFGGNYAPDGWALCDGRLLSIADNDALFALIGIAYGGDGETTFALPDLRGRLAINHGTGPDGTPYPIASQGGAEVVTLSPDEMPAHTHALMADANGANQEKPVSHTLARSNTVDAYIARTPSLDMSQEAISQANGGGGPHDNIQPYLSVTFIIALTGVWPPQN